MHPRSLPPFTVIRIPYSFDGGLTYTSKFFIILGHYDKVAFCLKPTSQTTFFDSSPDKMCGCVCYEALEVGFFSKRTIIDPDNQFEILHSRLVELQERGVLTVVGSMPGDFGQRLRTAMANSRTLDKRLRAWLRAALPGY